MHASSPKKRGAQPANANALKHGVYSRHYTPEELLALDRDIAGSLKDELEILRLAIFESAESVLKEPENSLSFHDNVSALRTITVAVARLENIVHVRMTAFGDPDRREKQVESMLARMEQSEMQGLDDLSSSSKIPGTLPKSEGHVPGGAEEFGYVPEKMEQYEVEGFEDLSSSPAQPGTLSKCFAFGEGRGEADTGPIALVGAHTVPERNGGEAPPLGGAGEHAAPNTSLPPPSKKKRGPPFGNSNAYKHGFYAGSFSPAEKKLLEGDGADQLLHEETLLRVLTRRTWHSMHLVSSLIPWQEYLFTVRTISYAVFVIAKLQRARRRFFGDMTDLEKDIQLGLSEACADLGILDYFHAQVNK
jgi:hypothetical protein